MSLMPTLKILFFHICIYAVASKLRTSRDKTQQRSLRVFSPALDVAIADITVKYNNARGYDAYGCMDPSKVIQSKYFAQVQYEIRNSGDADFIAPAESVSYAACGTPAILNFLSLKIEGGRDNSGNLYPAIELSRFATCVIDDSKTVDAGSCKSGGPSTDFTLKPVKSLGISQSGSYGVSKKVSVKFPLTTEQINALRNSNLTFTLSVNKDISPNGVPGVVAAVDGSKLKDVATWAATGQGTSVLLFMRPPSTAPTTAPSILPTTSPTTVPSGSPSTVPSGSPSTVPSGSPSTVPSGSPTTVPSGSPSTVPSGSPTTVPSGSPSTVPSGSPSTVPSGSPSTVPSGSPTARRSTVPSTAPSILPTTAIALSTDGLKLHYRFDSDSVSGSRVGNIASGSVVYDATLVNGATVSNNQLLLSAASSQYMSIDPFTTGTAGLTFATWYKSDNSGLSSRIFDFGRGDGTDNIFIVNSGHPDYGLTFIAVIGTLELDFAPQDASAYKFNTGNVWKHVAWTLDPAGSEIWIAYINGVQVGSRERPISTRQYPSSVRRSEYNLGSGAGNPPYVNSYLNGGLKDFRMYNRVLSAAEVNTLFTSTNTN